ncbi:MAG: DUF721 domain-containing protein [Cyanobacteria bacterium P01_F01_bin.150]
MSFSSLESLVCTLERRPQWRSHQKFQKILDCWAQVVGDVVAVQTRPLSIWRDVLSVSTSTPVWSQNLAFQRHHILRNLSTYVPDHQLKDIRFSPTKWLELSKFSKDTPFQGVSTQSLSPQSNGSKGKVTKDGSAEKNAGIKRSLKNYHFEQSEARSLWSYHPCKLAPSPQLDSSRPITPPSPEPDITPTPVQTFHDWAAKIQKRSQRLPKCPRCHAPTPVGELQRWSVCSLCVSQDW